MAIPANFPQQWGNAIQSGSLSPGDSDAVDFFIATSQHGCWHTLSHQEKENVGELRSRFPHLFGQAAAIIHKAGPEGKARADRILNRYKPETATPAPASAASSWDAVIERVNAQFGGR